MRKVDNYLIFPVEPHILFMYRRLKWKKLSVLAVVEQ